MLNKKNFKYYQERLQQHKDWNCKLPEAAALQDLVEKCIKDKDYEDFEYYRNNNYNLPDYEVIIYFTIADGYYFGIYKYLDEQHIMICSTKEGLVTLLLE